jgi:hypothetical protein
MPFASFGDYQVEVDMKKLGEVSSSFVLLIDNICRVPPEVKDLLDLSSRVYSQRFTAAQSGDDSIVIRCTTMKSPQKFCLCEPDVFSGVAISPLVY